jgi:hypothetical protein
MDTFSTVVATNSLGSFDNEANLLYRIIYSSSGMWAFIALKFVITIGFALSMYVLQLVYSEIKTLYVCNSVGLIAAGTFVTGSNFLITTGKESISILSLDAFQLSLIFFSLFFIYGLLITCFEVFSDIKLRNTRPLYRDQFGIWMPYDEDLSQD